MPHVTQILLATGIRDHADAYETALGDNGFHVHIARTGEDAMAAALGQRFDCIAIDLRLPDMPPSELCAWMKRDAQLRGTPLIVLTQSTVADDLVDAIAAAIAEGWTQRLVA